MKNLVHRFIVAGDLHYGNQNPSLHTELEGANFRDKDAPNPWQSDPRMELLFDKVKKEETEETEFFLMIGDIVQVNTVEAFEDFKDEYLSQLSIPYHAVYGNHDGLTDEQWAEVWGYGRDHAFEMGDYGMIILNSSDTNGARAICIGHTFLQQKLDEFKDKKGVFIFSHIPRFEGSFRNDPITDPVGGTDSPDCKDIMETVEKADNVVCMVHGHFHHYNTVMSERGIPIVFAPHFAHYGINYYGIRTFEIYDDGSVYSILDGFEGEKVDGEWGYTQRTMRIDNLDNYKSNLVRVTNKNAKRIFMLPQNGF